MSLVARHSTDSMEDPLNGPPQRILPDINDEQWLTFIGHMATAGLTGVSDSNALGLFEMMPRRLHDLGLLKQLKRSQSEAGRTIWIGSFVQLSSRKFLTSPRIQHMVFRRSMELYAKDITLGVIKKDPLMSLSGALAILHRCGPQGLESWASGKRFEHTEKLYNKVAGIF
jgi:hypothetical protein